MSKLDSISAAANGLLMLMSVVSAAYGLISEQVIWIVWSIWAAVFSFGTQA